MGSCSSRGLSDQHSHQPAATQEAAEHADHRANGARWCQLVRLVRPEPTPYQRPESSIEVPTGRLARGPGSSSSTCMFRGLSGPHLHQPAATQEVAGHVADHGANGPEVVLAGGAPSRRWAQQWYGLVVGVAWRIPALSPPGWLSILRPSYTLEVFAARRSAQTPRGVSSVTGDAATHKSALSREC